MTEEDFFDMHFDVCDDDIDNCLVASKLYSENYLKAKKIAERVSDGEIVDEIEEELIVKNLIYSLKFLYVFLERLGVRENIPTVDDNFLPNVRKMCKGGV